jgi:hypothetical protein
MKRHTTDARIISAFLRDTWLRDQQHATFTKLIRRASPNHVDDRGGYDDGDEEGARRYVRKSHVQSRVGESESGFRRRDRAPRYSVRPYGQKFANSAFVL